MKSTINYTDQNLLDVYPASKPNAVVVICVHGGGFIMGNKDIFKKTAEMLCEEVDYTVVVPNYTLTKLDTKEVMNIFMAQAFFFVCLSITSTTKLDYVCLAVLLFLVIVFNVFLVSASYQPEKQYHPCHVNDIVRCIQWTKHNITKYNGNPGNITVLGHSAGGFLVSLAACDGEMLAKHELQCSDVKGVVSMSGVFSSKRMSQTYLGRMLQTSVFSEKNPYREFPLLKVHPGCAPHFLINAAADYTLKRHTLDMAIYMRECGVWVQTAVYNNNSHFSIHHKWDSENQNIKNAIIDFIDQVTET